MGLALRNSHRNDFSMPDDRNVDIERLEARVTRETAKLDVHISNNRQAIEKVSELVTKVYVLVESGLGKNGELEKVKENVKKNEQALYGKEGKTGIIAKLESQDRFWKSVGQIVALIWGSIVTLFISHLWSTYVQ